MPDLSYSDTVEYLFGLLPMYQRTGVPAGKLTLDKTYALLEALGDPHERLRTIHVAGTNGKGTVSHTLATLGTASGLRTGLYTSPHYVDYRERIRVDGQLVSEEFVVRFVAAHRALIERSQASFFEFTVAMAFAYFAEQRVDLAVVEVGLGGRLDSTNVLVDPLVAVITNIDLDHTELLGDTRRAIAGEKAGIIKPGRPVVVGLRQNETAAVFTRVAAERAAPLHYAEDLISDEALRQPTQLSGPFARQNLRTALATWSLAAPQLGLPVRPPAGALLQIGQLSGYRGRFMELGERPLVLADAGHNPAAWEEIAPAVVAYAHERLHVVCGFVQGKEIASFLKLWPRDTQFYYGDLDLPRNQPLGNAQAGLAAAGYAIRACPSIGEAYAAARRFAGADDLIFVGGSSFVVGALLEYLERSPSPHA